MADTANTNMKAQVADIMEDQQYVYKKHDNYVVLLFKLRLPEGFALEKKEELKIGFQMVTRSERMG